MHTLNTNNYLKEVQDWSIIELLEAEGQMQFPYYEFK